MKCQVDPGWDLITPVGAPLEAVVDSTETAEEGGYPPEDGATHHSIKMYTGN